jgi:hypothetical protein
VFFLNPLFFFLAHHWKLKVVTWTGLVSGELYQGIVETYYEQILSSSFQRRVAKDLINALLAAFA